MNALTLACLLGTAASMRVMVDLSGDGQAHNSTNATNTTEEAWENPCPSSCGPDPCMDLVSPCDEFFPDMMLPEDEQDWEAFNSCWDTNPNANPWDACYKESGYGQCLDDEAAA